LIVGSAPLRRAGAALLLLAAAGPASAQRIAAISPSPAIAHDSAPRALSLAIPAAPDERTAPGRRATIWAPVASALVPGSGQAILGQDRFVAYLAIETFALIRYSADVREGRRQRRAYRELARDVARAYFSPSRPDGDFEYYERMQHWVESGVYDMEPGGDLQPERDATTFNGDAWLLARQTYWADPEAPPPADSPAYQAAIEFYERRAIRPDYRWSWRNAQLEQDLFARSISSSNAAFRRSVQDLGIIIANHALSTVDAYVTLRLRISRPPGEPARFEATLPWAPLGRPRDRAPDRAP
jgi:hypothetical protein